jgi:hypothetical protein
MLGKRGKKEEHRTPGRHRRPAGQWQAPPSYSYHTQRAERTDATGRQQPSLAQKRSRLLTVRYWTRRSGLLLAVVVALVCLVTILGLSSNPRIVLLDSGGSNRAFHDSATYQAAAASQLGGSLWNKNKITADTGAAATALKAQFPELQSVTITLPLMGHRPIYYLQAAHPAFVLQSVNGMYVLDTRGKALLTRDSASAASIDTLPVLTDQTGLHAQLGKQAISSQNATFIQDVIAMLKQRQVAVESLVLPANAAQELDVHIVGKPYVVKFNMQEAASVRQQVGTYLATANRLAGQSVTPAQYIDVRVLGRAYYQ